MSNVIKIKTGLTKPSDATLTQSELGFDKTSGNLYIGNNGKIEQLSIKAQDIGDGNIVLNQMAGFTKIDHLPSNSGLIQDKSLKSVTFPGIEGKYTLPLIEEGTSGDWFYRKYNNNLIELTTTHELTFQGATQQALMGGYYTHAYLQLPLQLSYLYHASGNLRLGTGLGFTNISLENSQTLAVGCTGNQNSNQISGTLHIIGR